jgi:hypothetical protein
MCSISYTVPTLAESLPNRGTFDTGSGYRVTWERMVNRSAISFSGSVEGNRWVSVGFSNNFAMTGSQAVIARFDNDAVNMDLYSLKGRSLSTVVLNSACSSCLASSAAAQVGGATSFEFTYFATSNEIPLLNAVLGENGIDTLNIIWVSEPFLVFWLNS